MRPCGRQAYSSRVPNSTSCGSASLEKTRMSALHNGKVRASVCAGSAMLKNRRAVKPSHIAGNPPPAGTGSSPRPASTRRAAPGRQAVQAGRAHVAQQ